MCVPSSGSNHVIGVTEARWAGVSCIVGGHIDDKNGVVGAVRRMPSSSEEKVPFPQRQTRMASLQCAAKGLIAEREQAREGDIQWWRFQR